MILIVLTDDPFAVASSPGNSSVAMVLLMMASRGLEASSASVKYRPFTSLARSVSKLPHTYDLLNRLVTLSAVGSSGYSKVCEQMTEAFSATKRQFRETPTEVTPGRPDIRAMTCRCRSILRM